MMKFSRAIILNREPGLPDPQTFIFKLATRFEHDEIMPPNTFSAKAIELHDNGWVLIYSHDSVPVIAYPPTAVVVLEGLYE